MTKPLPGLDFLASPIVATGLTRERDRLPTSNGKLHPPKWFVPALTEILNQADWTTWTACAGKAMLIRN